MVKLWLEVSKIKRINNAKNTDESLSDFIMRAIEYLLAKLEISEMENDRRRKRE